MKEKIYKKLVDRRINCFKCDNFLNQSKTKYDSCEIGNWTKWANNLYADVVIVGQDYANQEIFLRDEGKIETKNLTEKSLPKDYSTKTNYNLRELSKVIGYDLGLPNKQTKKNIFLTNAVLCLKEGEMNAKIPDEVYRNCSNEFLKPLIELISPKVIIALGKTATKSTLMAFKDKIGDSDKLIKSTFSELFDKEVFQIEETKMVIIPVYHPGSLGQANRKKLSKEKNKKGLELQKEDWLKITRYL